MVRLNRSYYSLLNFTSKLFSKLGLSGKIPANSANSEQFAHTVHEFREIRTIRKLIIHYVSGTCPSREPCGIPANYANSAQFAHTVRELRKIRTLLLTYLMFQTPAPAENSQEFQRIMQIPRSSPTYSANHAKFAKFANIIYYVSEACPSREPSAIPANYANSAQFAHTVRESREIRTI